MLQTSSQYTCEIAKNRLECRDKDFARPEFQLSQFIAQWRSRATSTKVLIQVSVVLIVI